MANTRTRASGPANAAAESEFGSAAQRDRHRRILDATLALASKGGYEAVQMRTVAERADVALGTLYRYFPSKIHLLVSALARELERYLERLERRRCRARPRTTGCCTCSGGRPVPCSASRC